MVKEQGHKIRVEEIMRAIRILQDADLNSKASKQSRLYLELAIIKMCKIEYDTSNEVILSRINKLEESLKSGTIQLARTDATDESLKDTHTNIGAIANDSRQINNNILKKTDYGNDEKDLEVNVNSTLTLDDVGRSWTEILEKFKSRRAMIVYASIVTAKPSSFNSGVVTLEYEAMYAFNKDRLQKSEYKDIVNAVFSETLKEKVVVKYIVKKDKEHKDKEELLKQRIEGIPFEIYDE